MTHGPLLSYAAPLPHMWLSVRRVHQKCPVWGLAHSSRPVNVIMKKRVLCESSVASDIGDCPPHLGKRDKLCRSWNSSLTCFWSTSGHKWLWLFVPQTLGVLEKWLNSRSHSPGIQRPTSPGPGPSQQCPSRLRYWGRVPPGPPLFCPRPPHPPLAVPLCWWNQVFCKQLRHTCTQSISQKINLQQLTPGRTVTKWQWKMISTWIHCVFIFKSFYRSGVNIRALNNL